MILGQTLPAADPSGFRPIARPTHGSLDLMSKRTPCQKWATALCSASGGSPDLMVDQTSWWIPT